MTEIYVVVSGMICEFSEVLRKKTMSSTQEVKRGVSSSIPLYLLVGWMSCSMGRSVEIT